MGHMTPKNGPHDRCTGSPPPRHLGGYSGTGRGMLLLRPTNERSKEVKMRGSAVRRGQRVRSTMRSLLQPPGRHRRPAVRLIPLSCPVALPTKLWTRWLKPCVP